MGRCTGCGCGTAGNATSCSSCAANGCNHMTHMGPPSMDWIPPSVCIYIDSSTGCVWFRSGPGGGFSTKICPGGTVTTDPGCACSVSVDGTTYTADANGLITLPDHVDATCNCTVTIGDQVYTADENGNITLPAGMTPPAVTVTIGDQVYTQDADGNITIPEDTDHAQVSVSVDGTTYTPDENGLITLPDHAAAECNCAVIIGDTTYSPDADGNITLPPPGAEHIPSSVTIDGTNYPPDPATGVITLPPDNDHVQVTVSIDGQTYTPDATGLITLPDNACDCVVIIDGTSYSPDAAGNITLPPYPAAGSFSLVFDGTTYTPDASGVITVPHAEDSDAPIVTTVDPANHTIQLTNTANAGGPANGTNGSPELIGIKDFIPPYIAGSGACAGKLEASLIQDGLDNTIPGQMFCANCATFVNCDCETAKLVNYYEFEKLRFTEGLLHLQRWDEGTPANSEVTDVINVYTDLGAPDCINAVEIHAQMLLCTERVGDADVMNVLPALVLQAGPGTAYVAGDRFLNFQSANFCSQSVKDLSDSNSVTELIPVDCDGNFWIRSAFLSAEDWESDDPRDRMDTFAYLSGWGMMESPFQRTGKAIWDYHGQCGAA